MVLCDFKAGIPHHIVFQDVLIIHQYFRIKKNGEKDIKQKKNFKKGKHTPNHQILLTNNI